MENSLTVIGHLLWLLFSKNKFSANSIHLIIKILDFLFYYQKKIDDECF